jgi:hypothetical protein
MARTIDVAAPLEVALEVAVADEPHHRLLVDDGRLPVEQLAHRDAGGDEGLGKDRESESQRRRQRLRERAEIDDAA